MHGRKMVFEPVSAALIHMGAQPFGGNQRLFLYVYPSLQKKRPMEAVAVAR